MHLTHHDDSMSLRSVGSQEVFMAAIEFRPGIDGDRKYCVIEIIADGKILGHMEMDAAKVEALILQLSGCRELLVDLVPEKLGPDSVLVPVADPEFHIAKKATEHGPLLALRHPGLGWVSFLLPNEKAAALAEGLLMRQTSTRH